MFGKLQILTPEITARILLTLETQEQVLTEILLILSITRQLQVLLISTLFVRQRDMLILESI